MIYMAITAKATISDHPLWRFSVKIWDHETAQRALQALENNYGLNPNVLLFCCWFGAAGQGRLTRDDINQLLTATAHWHERIVLSLQRLSKQATRSEDIYQAIAAETVVALHIEQLMLAEALGKFTRNTRNTNQKLTDACKNIALYVKMAQTPINPTTHDAIYQIVAIAFPTIDLMATYDVCKTTLLSEAATIQTKYSQQPLLLD